MTEINNKIHYGYKIDRIDTKKDNQTKQQAEVLQDSDEQQYVKDTGILGRSQVHEFRGGNIAKSVDEAVNLAQNAPDVLEGSETLFDNIYRQYLDEGMDEAEAYEKALFAEQEFLDIAAAMRL